MKDNVVIATAINNEVRAIVSITTDITKKAKELHNLTPVATAALGRALTGAVLISKSLKNDNDIITIQIKADGPMKGLIVVSDKNANVKGHVNNNISVPLNKEGKLDVSGALGKHGYLNIIMDAGLKEPYIGFVNLISGEIAEDLAYYYAFSEQIPTVISLGVLINKEEEVENSGGFMLQLLPGASEETISFLENRMTTIEPITNLISQGMTSEEILKHIFKDNEVNILEYTNCQYKCNCHRERMERNLITLGKNELISLAEEQEETELVCHFCNNKYIFTREELRNLI